MQARAVSLGVWCGEGGWAEWTPWNLGLYHCTSLFVWKGFLKVLTAAPRGSLMWMEFTVYLWVQLTGNFCLSHLYLRQVSVVKKLWTDTQLHGRGRTWECYFKATSLVQVVPGHHKSPFSGAVSFLVLKVNFPKKKIIFASCKSPTLVFKTEI